MIEKMEQKVATTSYSLNSFKGDCIGDYIGEHYRGC